VIVRFMRDRCTVSADSSGELLHRAVTGRHRKGAARETLAAGMLAAGGGIVSRRSSIRCGLRDDTHRGGVAAREVAPGSGRRFAMEGWPGMAVTMGERVRWEVAGRERATSRARIVGSDRDAGAIAAARANAGPSRCGGRHRARNSFRFGGALSRSPRGWVVTNPPYGVRVGDADQVRDLWASSAMCFVSECPDGECVLLSPGAAARPPVAHPDEAVAKTSNGGFRFASWLATFGMTSMTGPGSWPSAVAGRVPKLPSSHATVRVGGLDGAGSGIESSRGSGSGTVPVLDGPHRAAHPGRTSDLSGSHR
jgi:putative N6-adenine-specific DNA methylase